MSPLLQRVARTFPAPEYVAMTGGGIDISSGSVKSVTLSDHGGALHLNSYTKMDLEEGVVFEGDIEKPEKLVEVLRALRLRERIHFAHVSLLEKKSYLYQTIIPKKVPDMRSAVEFSLEGNVPLPPEEVVFDFEVVRTIEQGVVVAVTAYAKRIVSAYEEVFQKAGIQLRSLEVESQAAARAVIDPTHTNDEAVLLVDFGKETTRIAVVDCGRVSFSATVDVGGDAMASAIMKHFGISLEEAEKMKNEKGFLEGKDTHDLYEALMSTVSVLRDELVQHIAYWNTSSDEVPHKKISSVCVVGGNANVKGLPEFLSRALTLPVLVGNPWVNAFSLDTYIPPMSAREALQYTTTIGLALRSHKGAW